MNNRQTPTLFVIGTDTGVGKTCVAARIAEALVRRGLRVGVYKPVASGCTRSEGRLVSEDAVALWNAAGRPGELDDVCPQRFEAPVAPPRAAQLAGSQVDPELLRSGLDVWLESSEIVLVEGAGGLMSPLADDLFVADLAFDIGCPLLLVAPNMLGVINQTLQTLITASTFREGLDVAGIVLNAVQPDQSRDASVASNRKDLERYCVPPIVAQLGWQADSFDRDVDWLSLSRFNGAPR